MINFLNFNPYFRSTAYDSLKSCKLFDEIRNKEKESILEFIASNLGENN